MCIIFLFKYLNNKKDNHQLSINNVQISSKAFNEIPPTTAKNTTTRSMSKTTTVNINLKLVNPMHDPLNFGNLGRSTVYLKKLQNTKVPYHYAHI